MKGERQKNWFKIGVGLLICAVLLWLSVLVIPFLSISEGLKTISISGALIMGEVCFWAGAALTGKEFIKKISKR